MTTIDTTRRRAALSPLVLGANQPDHRPYRGGAGIARFRGTEQTSPFTPEDFVASTTEVHAGGGVGLTRLADGRTLRDAVIADPIGFLGEEHVRAFGARTMLLVKLLDTAERLFVHYHPDDAFAAAKLAEPFGKTEAWVVLDVADGSAANGGAADGGAADGSVGYAALGFSRDVSATEVEHWFAGQDADDMLGAMNRVELSAGDTLLVPAGLAHAIGPGLTLVELQQPTDLSVLLEYRGFNGLTEADALIGLELDTAIAGLDRRRVDPERLDLLASRRGSETLFPGDADPFFSASRVTVAGTARFEPAFSVLVVVDGAGVLEYEGGSIEVAAGMTVLTMHGTGAVELRGGLSVIRCRPPRVI